MERLYLFCEVLYSVEMVLNCSSDAVVFIASWFPHVWIFFFFFFFFFLYN